MAVNGNGTVWKSIALVLTTVVITGTPGIVYAIRTWSVADDVARIEDRQDDVRTRLTSLEIQVAGLRMDIARLQEDLDMLTARVDAHVAAPQVVQP